MIFRRARRVLGGTKYRLAAHPLQRSRHLQPPRLEVHGSPTQAARLSASHPCRGDGYAEIRDQMGRLEAKVDALLLVSESPYDI